MPDNTLPIDYCYHPTSAASNTSWPISAGLIMSVRHELQLRRSKRYTAVSVWSAPLARRNCFTIRAAWSPSAADKTAG
jgi:hypothetical protein